MTTVRESFTLWFIRNEDDPTFNSIAFKSQEEAQQAIDEVESWEEGYAPISVVFPVSYKPETLDRAARQWVAEQFEHYSAATWTTAQCWEFIDAEHHGGRGNFIIMSLLDRPHTR